MRKHLMISAALALGLLAARGASAQTTPTFTTLYAFSARPDGANPTYGGLISDASGALYGVTNLGGAYGWGTVFKLTPPSISGGAWTEVVLYNFRSSGGEPVGGLISDATGALYGVTEAGGTGSYSRGTVFKLTPPSVLGGPWTETVLHSFTGGIDGTVPFAGLISDASGAFYGTVNGGAYNAGTVFKLTPTADGNWTFSALYSFTGGNDGSFPAGGVTSDTAGALYGTAYNGGAYNAGTVFKLTPTADGNWTFSVLYSFTGGIDGRFPFAGLTYDATSGALYGTTVYGGYGYGAAFKLTPPSVSGGAWTETVLYSFTGSGGDAYPYTSLLIDSSGVLYGTASDGGLGNGAVFKLVPPTTTSGNWTETVLYSFTGGSDGAVPLANLISDPSGALYGTTVQSGSYYDNGTVFKLTLPATFTGVPGKSTCTGQSLSFANKKYGGMAHAAESLGYTSVSAFQKAVVSYCGG